MLLMCSSTVFYILLHLNPLIFESHMWLVATRVDLAHLNIEQWSLRSKSLHPLPQHLHQSQYFGMKKSLLPNYVQVKENKLKTRNLSCFCSVVQSCPTLQPHGLPHTRLPCPSLFPWAYSNSCPLSQWCHPTISSSVAPCSSCPQSFPASGSFPISWLFASGGQSIGASTSSISPSNE